MPIYEYTCSKCGKLNEVLQKVNDPTPERCDGCGAKETLRKVVSRSSFVLRGGGWYSDLYSSVKKDKAKDGKESKAADGAKGTPTPEKTEKPKAASESSSSAGETAKAS
jgi:putative FmdB family regulatory protein